MEATNCKVSMWTLFLLFCVHLSHGAILVHKIKVVEEPSTYGMNFNGGYQNQADTEVDTLKVRIQPSNFSGPEHLRRLMGKCYTKSIEPYKYELCPFGNMSQHEESTRWNPYKGILGVWQEWEIENNSFVGMHMNEGDACGSIHRTAKVVFKCGNKTEIDTVHEPVKCHYEMSLFTSLVCHPDSMLVYPTLSAELRKRWDEIETRLQNQEITSKGYKKLLRKVFEEAGYQLEPAKKEQLMFEAEKKDKEKDMLAQGSFLTLDQCNAEYQKAKDEVDRLRLILENNNIADTGNDGNNQDRYQMYNDHGNDKMDYGGDYRNMMDDDL